jgi:hypothetical protein
MTLRTLESCVSALQWVKGCRVILDSEPGRLPAIHSVTCSALAAVGTFCELSLVRIWFVAVDAFSKNERLFEIAIQMTLPAAHRLMFSEQRKFRFGMIEAAP